MVIQHDEFGFACQCVSAKHTCWLAQTSGLTHGRKIIFYTQKAPNQEYVQWISLGYVSPVHFGAGVGVGGVAVASFAGSIRRGGRGWGAEVRLGTGLVMTCGFMLVLQGADSLYMPK